jgi:hypothetical protein
MVMGLKELGYIRSNNPKKVFVGLLDAIFNLNMLCQHSTEA